MKPLSRVRIDSATACLVPTGFVELAISIAPRVKAPSNSRVTVSGSSTWSVPASVAARRAATMTANA
ncbi:MAG: hypothetical protein QOE52_3704 [Mycobacterium sp.]|nr:hypothetical protein [Mycobacterium sp.]MDT5344520.1 hypothetical protein [Mycobacterium sp.]MDT7739125.1 hypothetical protein [Mycobacterium sp.]